MRIEFVVIIGALTICSAHGQQDGSRTSVAPAPPLGYVLDPNLHALRPILGIPGAALIGPPLDLGFSIRDAAIGGAGKYALVIPARGNQASLVRLTDPVSVNVLPIVGRPNAIYFSPLGTAAALLTAEGSLVFVTEIGAAIPRVDQFQIGRRPTALAVSDDGAFVLAASSDQQELILIGRDARQVFIPAPGRLSTLAFRPSGYDALASGPDNVVWMVQPAALNPNFTQIAGPEDRIAAPVALAFTPNGKRAAIANAGNGTVAILDLQSGSKWSVQCSCRPNLLESLTTPGFFRVNEFSERPLFMVDTLSQRFLFVPPVSSNRSRSVRVQ